MRSSLYYDVYKRKIHKIESAFLQVIHYMHKTPLMITATINDIKSDIQMTGEFSIQCKMCVFSSSETMKAHKLVHKTPATHSLYRGLRSANALGNVQIKLKWEGGA